MSIAMRAVGYLLTLLSLWMHTHASILPIFFGGIMKKSFVVFALACLSMVAFAQSLPLSVGAGFTFSPISQTTKATGYTSSTTSWNSFAGKAFIDAKYIEGSLGFAFDTKNYKVDGTSYTNGNHGTWIAISALGKYPVELSGFTLFPMAGLEYDLNLSYVDANGNDVKSGASADQKAALNYFLIKGGVGADVPVNDQLFVRPTLLVGYKFHSKLESDAISAGSSVNLSITTLKFDIGVAIGYKL
jgi:hypothetical protein